MEKFEDLKEFVIERKYLVILGGIILLLLFISIYFAVSRNKDDQQEIVLEEIELEDEMVEDVTCSARVDIKGEVNKPGLYELKCEDRVLDVINLAGGLTSKADTSILNLGKKVIDEMVIIVLSKEQVKNYEKEIEEVVEKVDGCDQEIKNDACIKQENIYIGEMESTNIGNDNEIIGDTPVNNLISINKASLEELMTLSGIGKTKAESIISYRSQNGGFKSLDELKNVKGIGDSTFEKIKNDITL